MLTRRPWEIDFLNNGRYLRNWTEKTCRTYGQGLSTLPDDLTKDTLAQWVVGPGGSVRAAAAGSQQVDGGSLDCRRVGTDMRVTTWEPEQDLNQESLLVERQYCIELA
jgi:hypothetical protein